MKIHWGKEDYVGQGHCSSVVGVRRGEAGISRVGEGKQQLPRLREADLLLVHHFLMAESHYSPASDAYGPNIRSKTQCSTERLIARSCREYMIKYNAVLMVP
jgi:hypothetical protein